VAPITIRTKLDSETLNLPELRPFLGKTVEIRVREESADPIDDLIDWEYLAELEAELEEELAEDPTPIPTIEEIREMMSSIPGNMAAEIIADREDRC